MSISSLFMMPMRRRKRRLVRKPLAVSAYYARLTQRLISAISALTAEGRLYEVDMRLRPSGNKGPVGNPVLEL